MLRGRSHLSQDVVVVEHHGGAGYRGIAMPKPASVYGQKVRFDSIHCRAFLDNGGTVGCEAESPRPGPTKWLGGKVATETMNPQSRGPHCEAVPTEEPEVNRVHTHQR